MRSPVEVFDVKMPFKLLEESLSDQIVCDNRRDPLVVERSPSLAIYQKLSVIPPQRKRVPTHPLVGYLGIWWSYGVAISVRRLPGVLSAHIMSSSDSDTAIYTGNLSGKM